MPAEIANAPDPGPSPGVSHLDNGQVDRRNLLTRFFAPGEEKRIRDILGPLFAIHEDTVETLPAKVEHDFQPIHPGIDEVFREHYSAVKQHIRNKGALSEARQRFIGACTAYNGFPIFPHLFEFRVGPGVNRRLSSRGDGWDMRITPATDLLRDPIRLPWSPGVRVVHMYLRRFVQNRIDHPPGGLDRVLPCE